MFWSPRSWWLLCEMRDLTDLLFDFLINEGDSSGWSRCKAMSTELIEVKLAIRFFCLYICRFSLYLQLFLCRSTYGLSISSKVRFW